MSHYIKLSLQQDLALGQIIKLQDNTFFYFSFPYLKIRGRAKENVIKNYMEFKDTRI